MKLKDCFITEKIDDAEFLIAVGDAGFNGIIRNNKTAAFIVNCLKEETTKDTIVDKMCEKYDVEKEVVSKDVDGVLAKLRSIGALEE